MKFPENVRSQSDIVKSNSVQNPAPAPASNKEQSSTPLFSVEASPFMMNLAQQLISKADPAAIMLIICLGWAAVIIWILNRRN